MAPKIDSPMMSWKGWRFSKWFFGNWRTIKEGLKVGIPYVISLVIADAVMSQFLITIAGKFLIDAGEYWFKAYSN